MTNMLNPREMDNKKDDAQATRLPWFYAELEKEFLRIQKLIDGHLINLQNLWKKCITNYNQ